MEESGDSAETENENVIYGNSDSLKTDLLKNDKLHLQTKNQEDDKNKLKDSKKNEVESERSPDDPVLHNGRFNKEFKFPNKLGSGGFGTVCEATHKLDGHKYAVKKVPFKVKEQFLVQQDSDESESQITIEFKVQLEGNKVLKEVLREVHLLAKLEHKNVVRYNCSWLESRSADCASSESSSSYESPGTGSDDTQDSSGSCSLVKQNVILHIQMELCSTNLQKWLEDRNTSKGIRSDLFRDNIRIFKEMLEGIQYIHRKGLMHRDLKPPNIFLTGPELTARIGDFGLSNYKKVEYNDQTLSDGAGLSDQTTCLGTKLYAAPEIDSPTYDYKVDMYSLGIILFEMYNDFGTEWEKIETMKPLRSDSKCSVDFQQTYTNVAAVVDQLINKDPRYRPSAEVILTGKLFSPMAEATSMSYGAVDTSGGLGDTSGGLEDSFGAGFNWKDLSVLVRKKLADLE